MAHISGSFTSPYSGMLTVALQGVYFQNIRRDAGFPASGAGGNLAVRAYVGPVGSPVYGQPIDRYAPFASFEVFYPGGVVWQVGTVEVAHSDPSGLFTYALRDLNIDLTLKKR